jgi:hypothetical protein
LDLGKVVIRMTINTSSKTLEDMLKTHKYMQESKTHDGRSLDEDPAGSCNSNTGRARRGQLEHTGHHGVHGA